MWNLVSNHEAMPSYMPVKEVTVDNSQADVPNGEGAVRSCDLGDTKVIEDIVLWQPEQAFAYALRDGNDFGITNHLGVLLLAPGMNGGTRFRWQLYFDHPQPDAISEGIRESLGPGIEALIAEFGGTKA